MHKIILEENFKPITQPQRRLNPTMKEMVRKDVLKLLKGGFIYPISDSAWVSPLQVVPKKGGMKVIMSWFPQEPWQEEGCTEWNGCQNGRTHFTSPSITSSRCSGWRRTDCWSTWCRIWRIPYSLGSFARPCCPSGSDFWCARWRLDHSSWLLRSYFLYGRCQSRH